jgi:signal transduction histidine kinase
MRWPIQVQLLFPVLSVVLLAIVLASGTSAYLGVMRANRRQQENLKRVVTTLTAAPFPLSDDVLTQMSGLSGAEFVVFDADHHVQGSTLKLPRDQLQPLRHVQENDEMKQFSAQPITRLAGRSYLGTQMPVTRRGTLARPGWLVVLYAEDQWWAEARQAAYPTLLSGAVAALAVVVVTTMLARRFVRPIQQLGRQTAAIAQGDFQPVAVTRHDDEIHDLALSINRMTETLGRYEQSVRQNERLRTLGQLGAGMAHQLRNSATGASMAVELHQRQCSAGGSSESLAVALRQLRLMESYLQRFLTLGRPSAGVRQPVVLEPLVRDVMGLVGPACAHAKIDLQFQNCPEPLAVLGDAEALRQVLVNLLLNAVEAARGSSAHGARVVVQLCKQGADHAVLAIRDSGPGPAEAIRPQLFEPFVTEKPDGTGLGLFVARQIAEAHGGTIGWQQADGMTCFHLELPLL